MPPAPQHLVVGGTREFRGSSSSPTHREKVQGPAVGGSRRGNRIRLRTGTPPHPPHPARSVHQWLSSSLLEEWFSGCRARLRVTVRGAGVKAAARADRAVVAAGATLCRGVAPFGRPHGGQLYLARLGRAVGAASRSGLRPRPGAPEGLSDAVPPQRPRSPAPPRSRRQGIARSGSAQGAD